ncbi:hypothetical protein ABMA27_015282 [Loxostege sticticalis]|uniref:Chitin-binding type-2 domain-containing protein n=1 Tax=Loxostege sticticalis TaxID=481309 RepID=A0ABR3I738_LOXSC
MLPVWIALMVLPILGGAERFNCRGRILGAYYADAKSGCKAFHVCVRVAGGGIRDFRFFCPPGTLFHQEAQTCTDWGDDDPLACPADIYDGFDTKKLSSSANRDEESEFGLQRAETGDRRLSQNNAASDLRAAHSSDFFSGQRDRGRDDPAPAPHQDTPQQYQQPASSRQSFRRPTPTRPPPTTTQYTTTPPPPPPSAPSNPPSYETSKRKLVRKRPYYTSTLAPPTTFAQTTQQPQSFPEQQQQNFNRRIPQNRQTAPPVNVQPQNRQTIPPPNIPQQNRQTIPPANVPQQNRQTIPPANIPQQNRQTFQPANIPPQTRQTIPPVNVPPQYKDYKDEYVEVSRVTPKPSKYFQTNPSPAPFSQSSPTPNYNKKSLVELYNYDAQSTPGLSTPNDRPFKVRNSFSVADAPKEQDYLRTKNINANRPAPTTVDYNAPARGTASTPAFKNYNSVSYEPEKNNFISFSKQNYFTNPTTQPSTTFYTTTNRADSLSNLNTVAYNTNIGFNTQQSNYAESDEDDGQYRPPQGEDDGQYRPELYERELLSGAHSLNIVASGNRLPEDQKPKGKTQPPFKPVSQTAAPRPFRLPTSSPQTQRAPEQTNPTTIRPQTQPQPQSQRTFDYYQTYTTTSRPIEASASPATFNLDGENVPVRQTTTLAPRTPEPRQQTRAPTPPPQPPVSLRPTSSSRPFFANPANNKEDTSYDYAYYDSDPGFSEYDHIEEFGKTKKKA